VQCTQANWCPTHPTGGICCPEQPNPAKPGWGTDRAAEMHGQRLGTVFGRARWYAPVTAVRVCLICFCASLGLLRGTHCLADLDNGLLLALDQVVMASAQLVTEYCLLLLTSLVIRVIREQPSPRGSASVEVWTPHLKCCIPLLAGPWPTAMHTAEPTT
jgi:hypothetical protein